MSTTFYKQCSLQRKLSETSVQNHVAWIPEKFAKQDHIIKIKGNDGEWVEWVDGWKVTSVGNFRLEEKHLPDSHNSIKGHRKRTGDSTPKQIL